MKATSKKTEQKSESLIAEELKQEISASRFCTLKNLELAKAGLELDGVGKVVGEQAVKQWGIYADVTKRKLYEDDGFKSVGEFAERYFSESKASASHKASVYFRFFSDEASEAAKAVLQKVGTKLEPLYELSQLSDEELNTGLADGSIKDNMTLADARAYAKSVKDGRPDAKQKVIKSVHITGTAIFLPYESTDGAGKTTKKDGCFAAIDEHNVPSVDVEMLDAIGMNPEDKLLKAKFDEVCYFIAVRPNGNLAIFVATDEPKPKKTEETVIPAQVRTMIQNMEKYGMDVAAIVAATGQTEELVRKVLDEQ